MIVPCNSVKIRGKQVVKVSPRVSVVNLDVKGHNGTHTFVPRAFFSLRALWLRVKTGFRFDSKTLLKIKDLGL